MYCVIQKIQRKTADQNAHFKELLVDTDTDTDTFTLDGEEITEYTYQYSDERFDRILDAYKISIHHSYRENGQVKKKQWSICTMSYYDIAEGKPFYDFIVHSKLEAKAVEMGVNMDKLHRMIYEKLDPLENEIRAEYEQSEEYKTQQRHKEILKVYRTAKKEFEQLYGKDTYNLIYDVYGTLRNAEYLNKLIAEKGTADEIRAAQEKARQENEEYIKRSKEEERKRFEDEFRNSRSGGYSGSYSTTTHSNYDEKERDMLKEIYRMASKKFHPDTPTGSEEKMKFLTKLKNQWGL